MQTSAETFIRNYAAELGFNAVGIGRSNLPISVGDALRTFLAKRHHGEMAWMETRSHERENPNHLWPAALSTIVCGLSYAPHSDPLENLERTQVGNISVYARNTDYHDVLKKRLKSLGSELVRRYGGDIKVFVDTAPLMEKPIAVNAGLGWQGKHTNLVSREHGSWLFLGVILTTLELQENEAIDDHCGSCRRCLDICPTNAFPEPYKLDARRCISYLTIEHKGHIPRQFRRAIGNRIYGCDDCLAVCPWNKFASQARELSFHARDELKAPLLSDLVKLTDDGFRKLFKGSPIKRVGRDRFVRNVLLAIGNSGVSSHVNAANDKLKDASAIVRAAAIWALKQLLGKQEFSKLKERYLPIETDEYVCKEWGET